MCLEDFLESATRLKISELPHFWTWGEFALNLGRHINHHVAHKELMLQSNLLSPANIKIISISFMLFYVHYLKLPQLLTGPDSKLNLIAIDILTLYALIDSSFWFQTGPLYTSRGPRLLFPNKIANFLKVF